MKRLIVSADDFGMTEGINKGIVKSFEEGIVTTTSLMANMPGFEHAVSLAKANPHLAIGIHLNIMKGSPLQPISRVPSLVNTEGIFYPLPQFIKRLLFRKIVFEEIEQELKSQIEKVLATDLKVTHLDSHRHFHTYPTILKVIVNLADEYRINRIRYPHSLSNLPANWKELLLLFLSPRVATILDKSNIKHAQRFFEFQRIEKSKNPLQSFEIFCRNLPDGVTELCCHPGFITKELDRGEAGAYNREKQVEILTNPGISELLQQYEIKLISYGDSFE